MTTVPAALRHLTAAALIAAQARHDARLQLREEEVVGVPVEREHGLPLAVEQVLEEREPLDHELPAQD